MYIFSDEAAIRTFRVLYALTIVFAGNKLCRETPTILSYPSHDTPGLVPAAPQPHLLAGEGSWGPMRIHPIFRTFKQRDNEKVVGLPVETHKVIPVFAH